MRTLTIILSIICMVFAASAAKADKRVAFVVGNGTYKNVAALPNPAIDAKSMAGVLRNIGAKISDNGFVKLINESRTKPALAQMVAARDDLPEELRPFLKINVAAKKKSA